MAKKLGKLWPIEPHTLAKHAILRRYLDAWLPIMASWSGRILYIDGFAGPGRYSKGEDGSPIVALKAALQHHARITSELVYLFIEADPARKASLDQEVAKLHLPANIKVLIHQGRFDQTISGLLDDLDHVGGHLAPCFAFVDPFGWSHTPLNLVRRLLANPQCEAMVNVMYEEINRFIEHPDHADDFDELFGTGLWRGIATLSQPAERRRFIHDLYQRQLLQGAGARFVRSFEMRNERNSTDYFLFFATNSRDGLVKMKEAMWRTDPSGAFRFSDHTRTDQLVLFEPDPDFALLRKQLEERFDGKVVPIEDIESFVVEETAFLPTHYKRHVLSVMEREVPPAIEVVSAPAGRRRGKFPPGTTIRFISHVDRQTSRAHEEMEHQPRLF